MSEDLDVFKPDPADGIAPDQWAGVRLGLRHAPQAELDRMLDQYLEQGGRILVLSPEPTPIVRRHDYYYPDLPDKPPSNDPAAWSAQPGDAPLVAQLTELLDRPWPSRRAMGQELGISDSLLQRLLAVHFKADPRAAKYQRLARNGVRQAETDALWASRKLLVELILEQGICGYEKVAKASGLSVNMLYTLVEKFDLPIQKFRR